MNIIYSSDENYIRHAAASIASLLENNKNEKISIYLIENNVSKDSLDKLKKFVNSYNQEITYISINDVCSDIKKNDNFPLSSYARLFIDKLINVDKALYLDCDIIILESIKELYNTNIDEYLVAGVQDNPAKFFVDIIGMNDNDRYLNAGVLLMNLKAWRETDLREQFKMFIEKYDGRVPHHDQGIINGVCKGKILVLHPKYNCMAQFFLHTTKQIKKLFNIKLYYSEEELEEAKKNPVVVHYIAKFLGRPWEKGCSHPYLNKYVEYVKKCGFYQPEIDVNPNIGVKLRSTIYKYCPFTIYCWFEKLLDLKRKRKLNQEYKFLEENK